MIEVGNAYYRTRASSPRPLIVILSVGPHKIVYKYGGGKHVKDRDIVERAIAHGSWVRDDDEVPL